jgi:hypothetical protein
LCTWLLFQAYARSEAQLLILSARNWLYLLRLAAFICIALAIVRKNAGRG